MSVPVISGYTIHGAQASGTFGSVYRAVWDGKLPCAVKVLNLPAIHSGYVSWCLEKLRSEDQHPNVIAVYGFDLAHEPAYVATDWVEAPKGFRNLDEASGKWSVDVAGQSLKTLAGAMAWLHQRSIIHTGLTSGNVLLTDDSPNSICITDVGQGLIEAAQSADWFRHAPFLSPERCRYEAPQGETSGEAWDVYSFGVIGFKLLTGKIPRGEVFFQTLAKQRQRRKSTEIDMDALAKRLENEATIGWGTRATTATELSLRKVIERCLALSQDQRYLHMTDVLDELNKITFNVTTSTAPAESISKAAPSAKSAPTAEKKAPAPEKQKAKKAEQVSPASKPAKVAEPKKEVAPKPGKQPKPVAAMAPTDHSDLRKWKVVSGVVAAVAVAALVAAVVHMKDRNSLQSELQSTTQALSKSREQSAQSSEIAQRAEASTKQAVAEQQRLRLNLRHEQEMSDELLATLLDQKPTNQAQLEVWQDRLNDYIAQAQERLKNIGNAPELKESAARTRWNMAGIALALGRQKDAAGWLDEALREVDTVAAATSSKEQHAEWDLISGKIQSRRGNISLQEGRQAEAIQQLSQATKSLEAYLELHADEPNATRELTRVALLEGRALRAKPDPAAAVERMMKATDPARQMVLSSSQREEDVMLYVDLYLEIALAQVSLKQDDLAIKSLLDPLDLLRKYDRDHRQSSGVAKRLASYYIEMGNVLGRLGKAEESSHALNQGIRVLLDLVEDNPGDDSYSLQLGKAYGEVARLVNANRSPVDAIGFSKMAVDYLRILNERTNNNNVHYRLHYSIELSSYIELLDATSKFKEAIEEGKIALTILDELTAEGILASEEKSLALTSLASLHSSLGRSHGELKNIEESLTQYTQAVDAWQKIVASDPKDTVAQESLNRATEQLKRIKK